MFKKYLHRLLGMWLVAVRISSYARYSASAVVLISNF